MSFLQSRFHLFYPGEILGFSENGNRKISVKSRHKLDIYVKRTVTRGVDKSNVPF